MNEIKILLPKDNTDVQTLDNGVPLSDRRIKLDEVAVGTMGILSTGIFDSWTIDVDNRGLDLHGARILIGLR